jgi:hypothetical protein
MTTAQRIEANRANARLSTGPRTRAGKARASRNAFRHGLRIPVLSDPELTKQVEDFAHLLIGERSDPILLDCARRIAEAQIDLDRIRSTRDEFIVRALAWLWPIFNGLIRCVGRGTSDHSPRFHERSRA